MKFLIAIFVAAFTTSVLAKDGVDKKGKTCPHIYPMKGLNYTWLESVPKFYFNGGVRDHYECFLSALLTPEVVKNMTETEKSQACITSNSFGYPQQFYYLAAGTEPQFFRPYLNQINVGSIDWTVRWEGKEVYASGTTIVASDNESYIVGYDYWPKMDFPGAPTTDRGIWLASVKKKVDQSVHDIAMAKMKEFLGMDDPKEEYLVLDNSTPKCI